MDRLSDPDTTASTPSLWHRSVSINGTATQPMEGKIVNEVTLFALDGICRRHLDRPLEETLPDTPGLEDALNAMASLLASLRAEPDVEPDEDAEPAHQPSTVSRDRRKIGEKVRRHAYVERFLPTAAPDGRNGLVERTRPHDGRFDRVNDHCRYSNFRLGAPLFSRPLKPCLTASRYFSPKAFTASTNPRRGVPSTAFLCHLLSTHRVPRSGGNP